MSAPDLYTMINERFLADTAAVLSIRTIYDGFDGQQVKKNHPYVEFYINSSEPIYTFGSRLETYEFEFHIYSGQPTPDRCKAMINHLKRLYDFASYSATDGHVSTSRLSQEGPLHNNNGTYEAILSFNAMVEWTTDESARCGSPEFSSAFSSDFS